MDEMGSFDYSAKTVILGDSGVGKSSLLIAFTEPGRFSARHDVTIGVEVRNTRNPQPLCIRTPDHPRSTHFPLTT
jgi:GTPase SAR1 family protein